MREVFRSNDLVRLSFMEAVLNDADVCVLIMDQFASAVDGSIGALPRRLMVADDDYESAHEIIANLEAEMDRMENPITKGPSAR